MAKDRLYTLRETAQSLQITKKTLVERIKRGEIKAQRAGNRWLIAKKCLRAWVFSRIATVPPARAYKEKCKRDGIISEHRGGRSTGLNWYRYREPVSAKAPAHKLIEPYEAAVKLQGSFRYFAARMAPKNPALQDDLAQEMSLAVLQCEGTSVRGYFIRRARSRALNYLEGETLRGMMGLSEVRRWPLAPEPIQDEALLQLLKMAGIPVRVLADQLGIAISPDVELDDAVETKAE